MAAADRLNPAREVVLEVGAEGGSLTLSRERAQDGRWRFRLERNETTLRDVLLDDDQSTMSLGFAEDPYANSLDQALASSDQCPWFRLFPLQVHPQFLDAVLIRCREAVRA